MNRLINLSACLFVAAFISCAANAAPQDLYGKWGRVDSDSYSSYTLTLEIAAKATIFSLECSVRDDEGVTETAELNFRVPTQVTNDTFVIKQAAHRKTTVAGVPCELVTKVMSLNYEVDGNNLIFTAKDASFLRLERMP